MKIIAPITDYIPASTLTTLNDMIVRGAADPARRAEIDWKGTFIDDSSRSTGGAQVITGVGFTSKLILLEAIDDVDTNQNWSVGWDNLTNHMCIYQEINGTECNRSNGMSLFLKRSAGNQLNGYVSAIGADGFTITWALQGACGCRFVFCCIA